MDDQFKSGEVKIAEKLNGLVKRLRDLEREFSAGGDGERVRFERYIEYGRLAAAAGGATASVTLQPCSAEGDDFSLPAVNILLRADQEEYALAPLAKDTILTFVRFILPGMGEPSGDAYDGVVIGLLDSPILLGSAAYICSGTGPVTLDPCDADGVSTGGEQAEAYFEGGDPSFGGLVNIAAGTYPIPYQKALDGKYYILGRFRWVVTDLRYDTGSHQLQKKVRGDFGWFTTTESGWVEITEAVDCTAL